MTDREKPILVGVVSVDPDIYDPELDYYFNQFDSECGLQSIGLGGLAAAMDESGNRHRGTMDGVTVRIKSAITGKPINDPWATAGHLIAFSRGRRVWQRFIRLSYADQTMLRFAYTPRAPRIAGQDWGLPDPDRNAIVASHMRFRELAI